MGFFAKAKSATVLQRDTDLLSPRSEAAILGVDTQAPTTPVDFDSSLPLSPAIGNANNDASVSAIMQSLQILKSNVKDFETNKSTWEDNAQAVKESKRLADGLMQNNVQLTEKYMSIKGKAVEDNYNAQKQVDNFNAAIADSDLEKEALVNHSQQYKEELITIKEELASSRYAAKESRDLSEKFKKELVSIGKDLSSSRRSAKASLNAVNILSANVRELETTRSMWEDNEKAVKDSKKIADSTIKNNVELTERFMNMKEKASKDSTNAQKLDESLNAVIAESTLERKTLTDLALGYKDELNFIKKELASSQHAANANESQNSIEVIKLILKEFNWTKVKLVDNEQALQDSKNLAQQYCEQLISIKEELVSSQLAVEDSQKDLEFNKLKCEDKEQAVQESKNLAGSLIQSNVELTEQFISMKEKRVKKDSNSIAQKEELISIKEELVELNSKLKEFETTKSKLRDNEQVLENSEKIEESLIRNIAKLTDKNQDAEESVAISKLNEESLSISLTEAQHALAASQEQEKAMKINIAELSKSALEMEQKLNDLVASHKRENALVIDEAEEKMRDLDKKMNRQLDDERLTHEKELATERESIVNMNRQLDDERLTHEKELATERESFVNSMEERKTESEQFLEQLREDHKQSIESAEQEMERMTKEFELAQDENYRLNRVRSKAMDLKTKSRSFQSVGSQQSEDVGSVEPRPLSQVRDLKCMDLQAEDVQNNTKENQVVREPLESRKVDQNTVFSSVQPMEEKEQNFGASKETIFSVVIQKDQLGNRQKRRQQRMK